MPLFLNKGYGTEIGYIQQISIGHEGISGSIRLSFQQETL